MKILLTAATPINSLTTDGGSAPGIGEDPHAVNTIWI